MVANWWDMWLSLVGYFVGAASAARWFEIRAMPCIARTRRTPSETGYGMRRPQQLRNSVAAFQEEPKL